MGNFTTTICISTLHLPPEFVRFVNAQYPGEEPLGPGEEVPDVTVDVAYNEGWYTPARISGPPENSEPDDGENPDILSVTVRYEGYEPFDVLKLLPEKQVCDLESEAWSHQQGAVQDHRDYEPEHDPVDYNYDPY